MYNHLHQLPAQSHHKHQNPCHQHQEQQNEQQHSHHFLTETGHWLGKDEHLNFVHTSVRRRSKRSIPDTEKDDKYWEKRKRNNMAAKRSRENKRFLDNDMKQKFFSLEEQNILLRKELYLMKERIGLPLDQSILTPEDRDQCLLEVRQAQEANRARHRKDSGTDDVTSTSQAIDPIGLKHRINERDKDGGESSDTSESSSKNKNTRYSPVLPFGPSVSEPLTPIQNWGSSRATTVSSFFVNDPNNFPLPAVQSNLIHTSTEFQENNSRNINPSVTGRNGTYSRNCMHFVGQGRGLVYMDSNERHDWNISRQQRLVQTFQPGWIGDGALNLMSSNHTGLFNNVSYTSHNTSDPTIFPEDVSVRETAPLQEATTYQGQNCNGLTIPTQVATCPSTTHNAPTSANHS